MFVVTTADIKGVMMLAENMGVRATGQKAFAQQQAGWRQSKH